MIFLFNVVFSLSAQINSVLFFFIANRFCSYAKPLSCFFIPKPPQTRRMINRVIFGMCQRLKRKKSFVLELIINTGDFNQREHYEL